MNPPVPDNEVELSNTTHLYARPSEKERLLGFFTEVLSLTPREVTKAYVSAKEPMYYIRFSNAATISIEFTNDALSDHEAERAAWLELRVTDAGAVQAKATAFGVKRIVHPATPFFYVQAPGGQVFRLVAKED
jgi:hypothetical protein